ncbi:MAG: hypothetical protein V1776_02160 [Candidatus Diapherotrites archaeon]
MIVNKKGFGWTIELAIGMLLLMSAWNTSIEKTSDRENMLPQTWCYDLAAIETNGISAKKYDELLFGGIPIEVKNNTFSEKKGGKITCHVQKKTTNEWENLFIQIPTEYNHVDAQDE